MGSPGVVEGTQTIRYYWLALSWPWLLQPPRPHLRPLPLPRLMLIPGMGTTAMASTDLMATDTTDTGMDTITERGLLMLSPLLLLLLMLLLPLMLMPGTDTMAGLMPTGMDTGLMAMDTTTERGPLRLMLMPGTDTMAMASTDLMAMDTTDTGLMAMDTTTERGLLMLSPLLRLLLPPRLMLTPGTDTMAMVC